MGKLLVGGALGALTLALSACGGSSSSAGSDAMLQHDSDLYRIGQIEKTMHEALSKKDIDQVMSLFAPHATATFGPGKTVSGKGPIRAMWLKSPVFKAKTNWLSDHPAYKLKVTVAGDRGTLRFECHFVDVRTRRVVVVTATDQDVARVGNRWLITNFLGSTTELKIS